MNSWWCWRCLSFSLLFLIGAAEDAINQAREEFHAYLAANQKTAAQKPDYTDEELLMEERESELEFSGKYMELITKRHIQRAKFIWAVSWQNQQNGMCAQWSLRSAWASAQSDQCLCCLISVFAVCMMKAWSLSYPLTAQRRLWSAWLWTDWADAQADLSLRWAHWSVCWFCHVVAHIWYSQKYPNYQKNFDIQKFAVSILEFEQSGFTIV